MIIVHVWNDENANTFSWLCFSSGFQVLDCFSRVGCFSVFVFRFCACDKIVCLCMLCLCFACVCLTTNLSRWCTCLFYLALYVGLRGGSFSAPAVVNF